MREHLSSSDDCVEGAISEGCATDLQSSATKKRKADALIKETELSDEVLHRTCSETCECGKDCAKRLLSYQRIKQMRKITFALAPKERGTRIFEQLLSFLEVGADGSKVLRCKIDGRPCCLKVWHLAHGYSKYTVERARARILKGRDIFRSPNQRPSKHHRKRDNGKCEIEAMAWLQKHADELGEKMPTLGQTRIPYLNKLQVYHEYVDDMQLHRGDVITIVAYGTFNKLWRTDEDLRKIVLQPPNSGFAECAICGNLRRKIGSRENSLEQREKLRAKYRAHQVKQRGERQVYALHKEMAHREPEKYACVIIDGMTVATSTTPHPQRENKASESIPINTRFQYRLLGVKLHHGGETKHFAFMVPPWIGANGSDAVSEVVMRVIHEMGPNRPGTLFLQLDNCSENRSKTMLALISKLVEDNIFDKVQLNFLLVGHTHEDIDQWFSVFSKAVRTEDIWTVSQMLQLLGTMSEDQRVNPKIIIITSKHDYTSWLNDHIDPELGFYGRGCVPYEFWALKVDGETLMQYKAWGKSTVVLPQECRGIKVLLSQPLWNALKHHEYSFLWDEDEKCYNAVKATLSALEAPQRIVEEWDEFWKTFPISVDDTPDKFEATSVCARNVVAAEALAGPDVPVDYDEFQDSMRLVSHAGLPRSERARIIRNLQCDQRNKFEAQHAKNLVPLESNVFVVFIVESDFWDHAGFTKAEKKLKICIGKTVDAFENTDPDSEVLVSMFRCASGNPNSSWTPAVKKGKGKTVRTIGIPRGSIFFTSSKIFSAGKKLLAVAKREMTSYFLCPYDCPNKDAKMILRARIQDE